MRWGMVIDLGKCIGCQSCSVSCQETNLMPARQLRKVHDCGLMTSPPGRQRVFLPNSCMHCSAAPCEKVCPTSATHYRADGDVGIDESRCIGCGYCIVACPYRARSIYERGPETHPDPRTQFSEAPGRDIGICVKCTFCRPRIEQGLALGLQLGESAESLPACVVACSANALHFGDLDDPDSEVSRLIRESQAVRLQDCLGTEPAVYYIVPGSWLNELAGGYGR